MNHPFSLLKWKALFLDWSIFKDGLLTTLSVSITALLLALLLGTIFGIFSTSKSKVLKTISRSYVELIQNTPLLIQIFFWYNGLPYIGIVLPVFLIGFLGLGIYQGAYVAEVVKSGINSIPKGQMEAAYSQGFTYWEAMFYIILPQAKMIILPPLTNVSVNLIKNSSVLAIIAGGDLMYHADSWSSGNLYWGPAYVATGVLYFCLCYPLTRLAKRLEQVSKETPKVARVSRV
jgi:putative glutamine transport system permease protein